MATGEKEDRRVEHSIFQCKKEKLQLVVEMSKTKETMEHVLNYQEVITKTRVCVNLKIVTFRSRDARQVHFFF